MSYFNLHEKHFKDKICLFIPNKTSLLEQCSQKMCANLVCHMAEGDNLVYHMVEGDNIVYYMA
jgi:hypothetical protein